MGHRPPGAQDAATSPVAANLAAPGGSQGQPFFGPGAMMGPQPVNAWDMSTSNLGQGNINMVCTCSPRRDPISTALNQDNWTLSLHPQNLLVIFAHCRL